jgi:hypothetical protein
MRWVLFLYSKTFRYITKMESYAFAWNYYSESREIWSLVGARMVFRASRISIGCNCSISLSSKER